MVESSRGGPDSGERIEREREREEDPFGSDGRMSNPILIIWFLWIDFSSPLQYGVSTVTINRQERKVELKLGEILPSPDPSLLLL